MDIRITQSVPSLEKSNVGVPMADAGAITAPYRALHSVGQAISGIGEQMANYDIQRQRLHDDAEIARMRIQVEELDSAIQDEIAKAEPKKWDKISKDAWREHRSSIKWDELGLTKGARTRAEIDLEASESRSLTRVQTQLNVAMIQKDNAALRASAEKFARNGDTENALAEVQKMNLSPEQKEKAERQVLEKGDYEGALEELRLVGDNIEDAIDFLKTLDDKVDGEYTNYEHLTPEGRRSVRGAAERAVTQAQTLFHNELLLGIQKGDIEDPQKVMDWKESGRLTAGQAKNYINAYHGTKNVFSPTDHAGLRRKIGAYDPSQDTEGVEYSTLLGEIVGYPERVVTDLRNELNARSKPSPEGVEKRRVGDRLSNLFTNGFFSGGYKPGSTELQNEDDLLEANQKYLRIQEKADELLELYPQKPASEIMDMLFSEGGEGESIVVERATVILDSMGKPVSQLRNQQKAARQSYFRSLQSTYPKLRENMTVREATQAASGEKGLTAREMQRIRHYYDSK